MVSTDGKEKNTQPPENQGQCLPSNYQGVKQGGWMKPMKPMNMSKFVIGMNMWIMFTILQFKLLMLYIYTRYFWGTLKNSSSSSSDETFEKTIQGKWQRFAATKCEAKSLAHWGYESIKSRSLESLIFFDGFSRNISCQQWVGRIYCHLLTCIYIYIYLFPTCEVRVVRFYVSLLLLLLLLLFVFLFLLLLLFLRRRGSVRSLPRAATSSVPCRASTATICAQCSLPDLNRDPLHSVFPAGPQPRDRMSDRMSERMSEEMSERMSERMSKDMSERMSDRMSERTSA